MEQKSPFLHVFGEVAATLQQEGICVISGAHLYGPSCTSKYNIPLNGSGAD